MVGQGMPDSEDWDMTISLELELLGQEADLPQMQLRDLGLI